MIQQYLILISQQNHKLKNLNLKIAPLKLHENILHKIADYKEKGNNEIFKDYFGYHNPSFIAKDLYKVNQAKIERMVNQINDALVNLRYAVNKKTIAENKDPNKLIDLLEKKKEFNKQQKGKGLKISNSKQILQRLPILKVDNISENVFNEIPQMTYSLYREITKKAYSNIMNSIKV